MNTPLSFLFNEIVWTMNKHANGILKSNFGITFKQFLMMATLANIQPTTQHNLAQCLDYSDAAVSRMTNKLAIADHVTIQKDPNHLKKNVVALSDIGLKMVINASELLETEFLKTVKDAGINSSSMSVDLIKLRNKLKDKKI